jgi:mRNA deadenylase 3'-5' endonuclease subunit Ccr4
MYRVTLAHLAKQEEGCDQKSWNAVGVTLCGDLLKMHDHGNIGELVETTVNLKNETNYRLVITKESEQT